MSIYPTKSYPITKGLSEFQILKASHKFLREDAANEDLDKNEASTSISVDTRSKTWEDRLAEKYYENLYREFALCDLKHYKSGNFALRWRTESEVLSGAGETTCGNTRCKYHFSETEATSMIRKKRRKEPQLTTLELPFAYIEHGEPKNALVKVVLCPRCVKKLMWKRMKEKEMREHEAVEEDEGGSGDVNEDEYENEDSEDGAEKAEKRKGKEREKGDATPTEVIRIRGKEEDSQKYSGAAGVRRKRYHDERGERYSRRRSSRSHSPRHSHRSQSYYDRRDP